MTPEEMPKEFQKLWNRKLVTPQCETIREQERAMLGRITRIDLVTWHGTPMYKTFDAEGKLVTMMKKRY